MSIPTPGGPISTDNPAARQVVTLGDADYNWGTAAATLGQRPLYIRLPAGAPRILKMPPENLCAGWEVQVQANGGGSTIEVQDDAGNTIGAPGGTIANNAVGRFWCDGVTWHDLGELPNV